MPSKCSLQLWKVAIFCLVSRWKISSSTQGNLIKLFYKAKRYGKYSITVSAVESWNKIQTQLKGLLLRDLYASKIKTIVSDLYLKSYYKLIDPAKILSDFNKMNYCNYQLHTLDFCLLYYFLSSDSEAMTLYKCHHCIH